MQLSTSRLDRMGLYRTSLNREEAKSGCAADEAPFYNKVGLNATRLYGLKYKRKGIKIMPGIRHLAIASLDRMRWDCTCSNYEEMKFDCAGDHAHFYSKIGSNTIRFYNLR